MNKNIYIRDDDEDLWNRARELAGAKGISSIIVQSLRNFVSAREAKAKGFERIEVSFNDSDEHGIPKIKAFYGRWIFPRDKPIWYEDEEGTTRYHHAVAVTAKGAAVVLSWEEDAQGSGGHRFYIFPSLIEAAADQRVNWAALKAIKELGVPVEELDI